MPSGMSRANVGDSKSHKKPYPLNYIQRPGDSPGSALSVLRWHLYTIFLFTASDFKTIVIPKTVFGTFNALSGSVLSTDSHFSVPTVLARAPLVFLWAWINLLPFNINNQRHPEAVLEDSVNKAWRPMPSKRISADAAFRVMLLMYSAAFGVSWCLEATGPFVVLLALGCVYNNLGGADASCVVRNLLNAGLYLGFATGATIVAYGANTLSKAAWLWLGIIGLAVFSTVHMQDMPDQEGDRARGRNSVPLVIGDAAARWTIAVTMTGCSFFLPVFWRLGAKGSVMTVAIGAVVVVRVLAKRTVDDDEITWKIWNLWMLSVYLLPFIKSLSGV
ncbi:hypothetical protein MMC08_002737 [Hypocenomyce scalaris]|nr:hypothetical protein [Hypocenomyce scalaris]